MSGVRVSKHGGWIVNGAPGTSARSGSHVVTGGDHARSPEPGAREKRQYWGPPGLMSLFHSRIPPAMLFTSLNPALRRACVKFSDRAPLLQ
jgi:hypothetical protein